MPGHEPYYHWASRHSGGTCVCMYSVGFCLFLAHNHRWSSGEEQKKISDWRRGLPTCPSIYYRVECDCSFIVCLLRIWSTTPVYTEYSISMYRSIYFVYDCLCSTSPAVKPHVPAKSTLTTVRAIGENQKGRNNTTHYNNTTRGLQTCCGVSMTRDLQNDRQSTEPSMGLIPGNYTAGERWNGWIVCGKAEKKWFCGFLGPSTVQLVLCSGVFSTK